jgi:hypothetical protein
VLDLGQDLAGVAEHVGEGVLGEPHAEQYTTLSLISDPGCVVCQGDVSEMFRIEPDSVARSGTAIARKPSQDTEIPDSGGPGRTHRTSVQVPPPTPNNCS